MEDFATIANGPKPLTTVAKVLNVCVVPSIFDLPEYVWIIILHVHDLALATLSRKTGKLVRGCFYRTQLHSTELQLSSRRSLRPVHSV